MEDFGMDEALADVKLRDDLIKMYKNPIFKKILVDGYFKKEPARLAQAITNPEMQDEVDQRSLNEMIRGIGHLQNYLLNITQGGNRAELLIEDHKQAIIDEQLAVEQEIEIDPITGDECVVEDV